MEETLRFDKGGSTSHTPPHLTCVPDLAQFREFFVISEDDFDTADLFDSPRDSDSNVLGIAPGRAFRSEVEISVRSGESNLIIRQNGEVSDSLSAVVWDCVSALQSSCSMCSVVNKFPIDFASVLRERGFPLLQRQGAARLQGCGYRGWDRGCRHRGGKVVSKIQGAAMRSSHCNRSAATQYRSQWPIIFM